MPKIKQFFTFKASPEFKFSTEVVLAYHRDFDPELGECHWITAIQPAAGEGPKVKLDTPVTYELNERYFVGQGFTDLLPMCFELIPSYETRLEIIYPPSRSLADEYTWGRLVRKHGADRT